MTTATIEEAAGGGAITLCRCWRVERRDGRVLGFTDHDEPIALAGTLFEIATGSDAPIAEQKLGLSVEDTEISGALSSAALTEEDIAAGRYDGAEVTLFVVDWTDPSLHRRMGRYVVGEIVRADGAFRAELRGFTERLERGNARRFTRHCDAELGDKRCGVELGPTLRRETTVVALEGTLLRVEALSGVADAMFDYGRVEWLSGPNRGARSAIVRSRDRNGEHTIALWAAPEGTPEPGDRVALVAGCDKTIRTCRDRFGNAANFRGFPYLPNGDSAFRYAAPDGVHDGGPLVE